MRVESSWLLFAPQIQIVNGLVLWLNSKLIRDGDKQTVILKLVNGMSREKEETKPSKAEDTKVELEKKVSCSS